LARGRQKLESNRPTRRNCTTTSLNTAIKTYLTSLDPEQLAEADHRRLHEILTFVINIEGSVAITMSR
jgi:phosphate:Na+ symporter